MSDLHFFFLLCNFFSSCICNLLNNVKNEKGSWEGDSRLGLALPGHGVSSESGICNCGCLPAALSL
jgi:hypothetical protein